MTAAVNLDDLDVPYEPREPFVSFHQRPKRFGIMVCHRRAGKTVACVAELVTRALYTRKKNAEYAYIGPYRQQAKKIAWKYLKEMTEKIRRGQPRESDLSVQLKNGATITIYGADNPDAFRGLFFDGVVLDEFGDQRASIWSSIIMPCITDRNGWAVIIGTAKGTNHFYKKYKEALEKDSWYTLMLKASESGILTPQQMSDLKGEMIDEDWAREMECDFHAAVPGTYYANQIKRAEEEGRVGHFPYDPMLPVFASADIGISDSTAWWFWQVRPSGPVLIDYEEHDGEELDFYIGMLHEKPYEYETVYLPHDARSRSFQTGRTTIELMLEKGIPVEIVSRQKVQHGIEASRKMLAIVRFNQLTCEDGIEALRAYQRTFDEKTQQFANTPMHNWASDGADSFRYFALVSNTSADLPVNEYEDPGEAFDGPTLEEMFRSRENRRNKQRIRLR